MREVRMTFGEHLEDLRRRIIFCLIWLFGGLSISMITGPCTDTPTLRERTQALCGIPALNMSRGAAPI